MEKWQYIRTEESYTFGSANSTLGIPSLVANETGLRVISINYTVAPFSKWNQTTDEDSVIHSIKGSRLFS